MLTRRNPQGFTLIELLITLSIVGILLAAGFPGFLAWMQNTHIRNSAESALNGLALARTEAVRQNKTVNFQLVTNVSSSCALSVSGGSWVVSREDPSGKCNLPPAESLAPANRVTPFIVQARAGNDGAANAIVAAGQTTITFNSLGQATNLGASPRSINVTNPKGGACAVDGGPMHCLRVDVTAAGQIRMCDPALTSTDPRAC